MMNQDDLFNTLNTDMLEQENAPELDLEIDVIQAVKKAMAMSGMSRDQILERINLCLRTSDVQVTMRQLNHWSSPSQPNNYPAWVIPAICWATQSMLPLSSLLNPLNHKAIDNRADLFRQVTESKILAGEKMKEAKALEKMAQRMVQSGALE